MSSLLNSLNAGDVTMSIRVRDIDEWLRSWSLLGIGRRTGKNFFR